MVPLLNVNNEKVTYLLKPINVFSRFRITFKAHIPFFMLKKPLTTQKPILQTNCFYENYKRSPTVTGNDCFLCVYLKTLFLKFCQVYFSKHEIKLFVFSCGVKPCWFS